jgi:ribosomal protein S8
VIFCVKLDLRTKPLETSLTGKALTFGLKEYGFESRVSNLINNNPYNELINHIKFNYAKKSLMFYLVFSKKNFKLCKLFKKLSIISAFFITFSKSKNIYLLKIHLFYFYGSPIYNFVRQISKNKKNYYISYRALSLINRRLGASIYILSTDLGLITHREAIKHQKGGKLVLFIYY